MLDIQIANYPDRLGPSSKYVENSTKPMSLKLPVIGSSTVQYRASRTSNQALSKGLDASTCCNFMFFYRAV